MRRREFIGGLGAAALTAGCGPGGDAGPASRVRLTTGDIEGRVVNGVHRFLGIPYAEPPFGNNRFMLPVPRRPWDGVRQAFEYGPICPQTGGAFNGDVPEEGEDCLSLNVWTPDPGTSGLPVMVWAHGGGQVSGTGASPFYDGTRFANDGVVLITCNRRLGAEGYLYLPEHFGDGVGPGNLGIEDLIEVLRWVQDNARAFGGDPGKVTLFGESGGGAATQAVVATPAARGLLHRVILQSGGHSAQYAESASALTATALDALGIKAGDLDALREVSWTRFAEIYEALQASGHGRPQVYIPVISEAMPLHPVDATYAAMGTDLDYLIGTCRDEFRLFAALLAGNVDTPFHHRVDRLIEAGGGDRVALAAAYRAERPVLDEDDVQNALIGDMWFRVPGIRIADGHASASAGRTSAGRTYMYRFDWESQTLGAAHAMDIAVFGNGVPYGVLAGLRSTEVTATQMRKAWVRYAETGDPGWAAYDTQRRLTMSIDDEFRLLEDPFKRQREALGEVLTMNWQSRRV